MSRTTRLVAVLVGALTLGLLAITGVGSAAGTSSTSAVATPSFPKLSQSQVKTRSNGKQERVVVVFKNQLGNLPANEAHRQARESTASSMQELPSM